MLHNEVQLGSVNYQILENIILEEFKARKRHRRQNYITKI